MNPPALSRSAVDRAAEHRRDEAWLASAWESGRLLMLDEDGRTLVDDDSGSLALGDTTSYDGQRFLLGVGEDGVAIWAGVGELPRRLGARAVPHESLDQLQQRGLLAGRAQ